MAPPNAQQAKFPTALMNNKRMMGARTIAALIPIHAAKRLYQGKSYQLLSLCFMPAALQMPDKCAAKKPFQTLQKNGFFRPPQCEPE